MKSFVINRNFFLMFLMLCSSVVYPQIKGNQLFIDSTLRISEIGMNSIHSDFGPFVIQDTLYFTTFNDNLIGKTDLTLKNKEFYDLYRAPIDKKGDIFGKREPVEEFITRFNDGPVAWCANTDELFVTQNYKDQTKNLKPFQILVNRLRIIIAKRVNGKWRQISEFPYNNPAYSVGHPAVTKSGDTLIFSSDKPGGFGGTDLYYSVRKNGKWEEPVNLGPKINTFEKEEFPFLTDHSFNGQFLVFASNRAGGLGGLDLYYTPFPSDFSVIGHFVGPINTKNDDFAMTIPPEADFGYLTSNRPGGKGHDDIYKFTFKRFLKPVEKFREVYVFDKTSNRPIPQARINLCDKKSYLTDLAGKVAPLPCMETDCEVNASAFGYKDKSIILLTCDRNSTVLVRDTIWMNILVNQKIVLKNIYYDFDKWDILPESGTELDQLVALMKANPEMKVELSSHTDERGTVPYNQKLSQRRAQSAVDYIVSKGIDQLKIKAIGYGKSQLIYKSTATHKCTPEEHRQNRRTEIFIPGFLKGEPVKQEKGDYSNGRHNAAKGYSSSKELGSSLENAPKTGTLPTIEKVQKIQKVTTEPNIVKTPGIEKTLTVNGPNTGVIRYYLVLGSFNNEQKALKFVEQLKSEGYIATLCSDSAPFRVGIGYSRFSQTKEQLEILKSKYKGVWILTK